jgi:uncharacterized membrane-anchored protein
MNPSLSQPRELLYLNKVPQITLYFWIIKVLSTTVGETGADFLSTTLGYGLKTTSLIMTLLLAGVVINQLRLKRYIPISFWLVVVLVSVVGTLVTDLFVDQLGITLISANVIFGSALLIVFGFWYAKEQTLAMKSINTYPRELYYWTAVLFTFAMGTATGDLVAEKLNLGYGLSTLFFAGLIGVIGFLYASFHLNGILAFWLAFILTRPLGASLGDLLSQPQANGGWGWGPTGTSVIFLSTISILVIYLPITRKDVQSAVHPD